MGILDDAIREHLELKRQRGATESELKQLEDEAFGPPSRPGEPDFPESLFYLGAILYDSAGEDVEKLQRAKKAWSRLLEIRFLVWCDIR